MRKVLPAWSIALVAMLSMALSGCRVSTEMAPRGQKSFYVNGMVTATDPANATITLKHDAIPGFMGAMTMPYRLYSTQTVSELHVGDRIHARLQVQPAQGGSYSSAVLSEVAVTAQARPDFRPPPNGYHVPTPGDAVPNIAMVNQDGHTIHLADFRGRTLLITFIYTRCPLNDLCPRMSRNFAAVHKQLKDTILYDSTALLSISFDPAVDTPAVLHAYGTAYTGNGDFSHWQFATPSPAALDQAEHFFNVGATPGDDATISHSLSTVLIGPDGKIAAWFPGNEWTPDEVSSKIRQVVAAEPAHTVGRS